MCRKVTSNNCFNGVTVMRNINDSLPSPEFTPISLAEGYNRNCAGLSKDDLGGKTLTGSDISMTGRNVIRGIPFNLGASEGNNIIFLKDEPVTVNFDNPLKCNFLIFIHTAVPKRTTPGWILK